MTAFIENIRKVMGWCPNASMIEARKTVLFDDLAVNAPDGIGGLRHWTSGWWGKYRNRTLLNCFFATLLAITFFNIGGRDKPDIFIIGIIAGMIFSIITWITEWRRFNKAAAGEYIQMSVTRRKKIMNYRILVGFIMVVMLVIGFFLSKTGIRISEIYAFLSGLYLFIWTQYLEVIYWERKNRKMLVVDKTSFYAVDIDSG